MIFLPCDELMLAVHHDPFLAEDVLLLLRVHDVLLLQTLEGVSLTLLLCDLQKNKVSMWNNHAGL